MNTLEFAVKPRWSLSTALEISASLTLLAAQSFSLEEGCEEFSNIPLGISLDHGTIDAAGTVLASHGTPGWKVGELPIRRISCGGPIYLELRDEQRILGPFSALEIGAETISTADGPFASYDALAQRWQLYSKDAVEKA